MSYGNANNNFATNDLSRRFALDSLIVADKENIGFTQFIELHKNYLEGEGCSDDEIDLQIEKVKKLNTYFIKD